MSVKIINNCYFRSMASVSKKKALIQLTTKCNMACKHCFVSAEKEGMEINFDKILEIVKKLNVERVTLTGGEPLLYSRLYDTVKILRENDMKVTICTNGLKFNEELIKKYSELGIKVNVSLDSIVKEAYEKFRGKKHSFEIVLNNIKTLKKYNMLKGILVTPNIFSSIDDYVNLILEMEKIGAEYVLFNPLAEMGRGKNNSQYGVSKEFLLELKLKVLKLNFKIEVVLIKFPNDINNVDMTSNICERNKMIYIYANGNVVNCPYLDFVGKGEKLGNIFHEEIEIPVKGDEVCDL